MPRYELVEGSSSKFWEIQLEGRSFTTRWGRIGTEGQSQTKSWANPALAQKEYEKLVADKTKKGYREVGGSKKAKSAGGGGKAKRNPELEKAILAAPDDTGPYLVYADWLQEQGDPRGELIAVQHARSKNPKDKALQKKEAEVLEAHAGVFLGPLTEYARTLDGHDQPAFEWHLGFIRTARFAWDHYVDESREHVDLGKAVRLLLEHPSGIVLRQLTIGLNRADPDQIYQGILDAIAKKGAPALETLHVGDYEYPDETEISWTELGKYDKVWAAVPRLRKLVLQGNDIQLGKIDAPELRDVEIRTGGLPGSSVKSVAAARWPRLERLICGSARRATAAAERRAI